MKAIEIMQGAMKKQFDKKQMNPQRLRLGTAKISTQTDPLES